MAFGPNPPPIQAHICVKDGLEAIAFYEKAFGAKCPFHQLAKTASESCTQMLNCLAAK